MDRQLYHARSTLNMIWTLKGGSWNWGQLGTVGNMGTVGRNECDTRDESFLRWALLGLKYPKDPEFDQKSKLSTLYPKVINRFQFAECVQTKTSRNLQSDEGGRRMSIVQLEGDIIDDSSQRSNAQGHVEVHYENINSVDVIRDDPETSAEGSSQGVYKSLDYATRNIQQEPSIYKSLVFHQYQNVWMIGPRQRTSILFYPYYFVHIILSACSVIDL